MKPILCRDWEYDGNENTDALEVWKLREFSPE